ncbi:gelsolin-like protein 2 [Nematostella vectensis]|uniref:gelsolin-like protein 2 n=1 Tax=Nematostella vectensis TaxID=45351 RepID=UPI002076D7F5|nr:gelsolin-like protein 2 [Nematostella vectensis]
MSGLRKQEQPKWQDTNLALFGSDIEKNVKREAAGQERAWSGAGKREGLQIWRVEQFKVKSVLRDDYGKFYDGDSYIILNTYKDPEEDEFKYDVHFWIGQDSTQDEYGTAAYKTVELDIYLNDKPVQHREVQGHESKLFMSYFDSLTILKGGVKSGFKHVRPEVYQPRLLRVYGTTPKSVKVEEVPFVRKSLNSDDVFILDKGKTIYQWNGKNCDKDEKFRAVQEANRLKSERGGRLVIEVIDEGEDRSAPFYRFLPDLPCKEEKGDYDDFEPVLLRVSDASGQMKLTEMKKGKGRITRNDFDEKDVFLFDTGNALFVYSGNKASIDERRLALQIGTNYLNGTNHPFAPISAIYDGRLPEEFLEALAPSSAPSSGHAYTDGQPKQQTRSYGYSYKR